MFIFISKFGDCVGFVTFETLSAVKILQIKLKLRRKKDECFSFIISSWVASWVIILSCV
jgi:hypothetical protein